MMKVVGSLILGLGLTANAVAADFNEDIAGLRSALQIWKFSDDKLESFLDPLKGNQQFRLNAERAPWAGNYFPMADGGIANRWRKPVDAKTQMAAPAELDHYLKMSKSDLAKLSPAEKYDLLLGNYDLPVTKFELQNRGPLRPMKVQDWEGFCNGVRCAGINLKEPKNDVIVTNRDGLRLTFEPADLKALAGASYFYVENYAQAGSPSDSDKRAGDQPNPAVFDAILRYFLSDKQKAFVIDSHLGSEIWNESVVGYRRTVSEPKNLTADERRTYRWAVSKVEINGELETLGELGIQDSNNGKTQARVARGEILSTVPIRYTLYLDENGRAYDGEWQNFRGNRGVDFVWFGGGRGADHKLRPNATQRESLSFNQLKKLFKKAQHQSCSRVFGS